MKKEQLIDALSQPVEHQMVNNLKRILETNQVTISDIFDVSLHHKKEVAFRAAWMLEYVLTSSPNSFKNYLDMLFKYLPKCRNQSVMRHYSKMVALLTSKNVNQAYLSEVKKVDFQPVTETLFKWLIEKNTLVATKVHCMQALANLSAEYKWIADELIQIIDYLEPKESIAFFARAKVVKKTLIKQNRTA
jgi:hypothetical protein